MGAYSGWLACPRCGRGFPEAEAFLGCPDCLDDGVGANPHPLYELDDPALARPDDGQPGLFRWRGLLPLAPDTPAVSLAEGGTPLRSLPGLAERVGVGELWVKDESRNPTWSYKDRLAAVAVTKAAEAGADTVVVSTTGNHGAAAAAYAAQAGLRCVVLTLASVPPTMKTLMQAYGAEVVALRASQERWSLMARTVEEWGWVPLSNFCDPPVGSNPFGVDGYKTIAYELWEALDLLPGWVVVPTAYADGLAGIHRGFIDLVALGLMEEAPRLVAAEPLGPYQATLEKGGDRTVRLEPRVSVAFSTASPMATYQGLRALRDSRGVARAVPDDREILAAQLVLAREAGLYLEAAAALCLPVIERLVAEGVMGRDDRVVVIGTSSGLKDPAATARMLPEVPVVDPTLEALDVALGEVG